MSIFLIFTLTGDTFEVPVESRVDTYTKMSTMDDFDGELKEFPCKTNFSSSCDDFCEKLMTSGVHRGRSAELLLRTSIFDHLLGSKSRILGRHGCRYKANLLQAFEATLVSSSGNFVRNNILEINRQN